MMIDEFYNIYQERYYTKSAVSEIYDNSVSM